MEVPVVLPKRPKAAESVEGELSTLNKNSTVKVTADGKVYRLQDVKKEESESSEESDIDDGDLTMGDDDAEVKDEIKEESEDEGESEEES